MLKSNPPYAIWSIWIYLPFSQKLLFLVVCLVGVSADLKGSQSGRFGCEPESSPMVAGHTNAPAATFQCERPEICEFVPSADSVHT
jgi:hypothetical protein